MASCCSYTGEFVITVCSRLWWMSSFPSTYSKIAESPLASEIEMCTSAGAPFGALARMTVNGSGRIASTASATVP